MWILCITQAFALEFAVIGDFGDDDDDSAEVAAMVAGWAPELILTVGDNDYSDGAYRGTSEGLELGVGQHYGDFVEAGVFYPSPGDHDWGDSCDDPEGLDDYLDYFELPTQSSGNERYYSFREGPVHFFSVHSVQDCEPDGADQDSRQAQWLREEAAASDAPFKVAYMHHPPWSSGDHGTDGDHMQWPWSEWGFDLVLSGHDHDYERIWFEDVTSVVVGIGGVDLRDFGCVVAGSQVRFAEDYGALKVSASETEMVAELHTVSGEVVDRFVISPGGATSNTVEGLPAEECSGCGGCSGGGGAGAWILALAAWSLLRRRSIMG
jgi:hypothetical protein